MVKNMLQQNASPRQLPAVAARSGYYGIAQAVASVLMHIKTEAISMNFQKKP